MDCLEHLGLVWKKKTFLIAPICPQVSQITTKALHSLMRFRCHRKSIHVHATVLTCLRLSTLKRLKCTLWTYAPAILRSSFSFWWVFDLSHFHTNTFRFELLSRAISNRCVFKQKHISVIRASEFVFSSVGKFWDARELETPDRPTGLIFRKEIWQKHTNTNPSGKFFNFCLKLPSFSSVFQTTGIKLSEMLYNPLVCHV